MSTTRANKDKDDVQIRPFADFLREQARGQTHDELSEGLRDLVARVQDTGKKGTLTLTVEIAPMPKGGGELVVSDSIKLKLPEHERNASIFFADKDNNLRREDPNAISFDFLYEVPPPPGVDPNTGEAHDTAN